MEPGEQLRARVQKLLGHKKGEKRSKGGEVKRVSKKKSMNQSNKQPGGRMESGGKLQDFEGLARHTGYGSAWSRRSAEEKG